MSCADSVAERPGGEFAARTRSIVIGVRMGIDQVVNPQSLARCQVEIAVDRADFGIDPDGSAEADCRLCCGVVGLQCTCFALLEKNGLPAAALS